jgi:hypothetical protein
LAKIARAGFKSAGNSKGLKHLLSTSEFNVRHCPILELCKSYPTEPETPADSAVSVLEEAAEDAFSERSNIPTPRLFNSLRQQMEEQEAPEVLEPEPEPEQEQEQEQEPPSRPKIPRIRIKALYSRFITYLWQRGIRT